MKLIDRRHATRRRQARGFTLVELLVALTISLLITIVIAQLFLGSRQTFATTDDVSRMQENMRFAQQLLVRTIHLAGYKSAPNTITANIFSGGNIALAGVDGGGTAPDEVTVRYQGSGGGGGAAADGTIVDCLGNRIDANIMADNTFFVAPGANGRNALFCRASGSEFELIPGVQNLQVLYGEDTDANLTANRYVPLSAVANLDNVVSVRVALLFETPTEQGGVLRDDRVYDLNGTSVGPFNDLRMRRVVTTTINLRNRTP